MLLIEDIIAQLGLRLLLFYLCSVYIRIVSYELLIYHWSKKIFCLLFCVALCCEMCGQVNIKIGYNVGFPQLPVNDALLSQFSPNDSEVVKSFGSTSFMHGIQIGGRYRMGNVAFELGWENLSRDRSALFYNSNSDSFSNRDYGYSINGFTMGFDNYIGKFGWGSQLLYHKLNIDRRVGNNDLSLVGERNIGLRLQFIWQVQQSSLVSLMIKPYYQFSLSDYDLTNLATDLNVVSSSNNLENPKVFGVSLVFYNGKQ